MSTAVRFYLGPVGLNTVRTLTITRMPRSGDDDLPLTAAVDTDLGAVEESTQTLDNDEMYQAVLTDEHADGTVAKPQTIQFNTAETKVPGPSSDPSDSLFRVLSIVRTEESSSSSSSSSSSGA